ncbi:MAG: aspartate carbamoyltransferase catalytic subunit [Salinibacter sp.]
MADAPSAAPSRPPASLRHRHLLDLSTYEADELRHLLDTAQEFRAVLERPIRQVPTLQGTSVASLFFEPSTRTKLSFNLAAGRLSAETVSLSKSGSSVKKGETLKDTARNVEAMKVDVVILRHSSPGAPHFLARCTDSVIINAGDGAHAHPTQALLDVLTMREHVDSFEGLQVSIIGDITHSRVARSNVQALTTLGAEVTLCGPATMLPVGMEASLDVRTTTRLAEALEQCDIGITPDHLRRHPDLLIMHPGPVNRGIELADEVVDHERAIILRQVTNGVALRMAVLYLLAPRREEA